MSRFKYVRSGFAYLNAALRGGRRSLAVPQGGCACSCHWFFVVVIVTFLLAGLPSITLAQAKPGAKTKSHRVTVHFDLAEAPEAAEWSKKAREVILTWYPRITKLLETDHFTPPTKVEVVIKKNMGPRVPATTSGNRISISSESIAKRPDEFGMLIHELTHVIQQYPHSPIKRGWVTEGIADYVRFFHYEPGPAIGRFHPDKAQYTDGYRTAARFFDWIEKNHDKKIVKTLNRACRHGQYKPEIFQQATSKSLDELWAEFIADARTKQAEAKPKRGS